MQPKIKIYFINPKSFDSKIEENYASYATSIEHPYRQYVKIVFDINGKEYPIQRAQSLICKKIDDRDYITIDFYGKDLVDLIQISKQEYDKKFR